MADPKLPTRAELELWLAADVERSKNGTRYGEHYIEGMYQDRLRLIALVEELSWALNWGSHRPETHGEATVRDARRYVAIADVARSLLPPEVKP